MKNRIIAIIVSIILALTLSVGTFAESNNTGTPPEGMDLSKAKLVLQNYDVVYNSNVFLTKPYEMRVYML